MNVQVIVDAAGRLVWASAAIPGSAHDLTAARTHGIIAALTNADVMTFADKAYQGVGGSVRTRSSAPIPAEAVAPAEGREQGPRPDPLPRRTRRRHPQDLEILTKLRCSPSRTTAMVQAILALHHVEHPTCQG
jgi:DDE superfamily endonuclease